MDIKDQISDAIKKQKQYSEAPQSHRDFIESLIVGRITNLNQKGIKIYWVKQGLLYVPFTTYEIE